jgi:hypothetical protein
MFIPMKQPQDTFRIVCPNLHVAVPELFTVLMIFNLPRPTKRSICARPISVKDADHWKLLACPFADISARLHRARQCRPVIKFWTTITRLPGPPATLIEMKILLMATPLVRDVEVLDLCLYLEGVVTI